MLATTTITARQIMATKLVALTPELDAFEAIDRLLANNISGAPVVDGDGRFLGVFSEHSAIQMLVDAAYDQHPSSTIGQFVRDDVHTAGPDVDLLSIAQLFLHSNQRRLPIVDDDDLLVGQVSRRDVLRAAHSLMQQIPEKQPRPMGGLYLSSVRGADDTVVF